ncbi:MAG: glycosyltransferase [Steroidobacteraceae bacterium]
MKRILVYSHDTYGLGNIRRMLEISRHLVDRDPRVSILILSGSPMLHAFRIPARIDYVKLPCLTRTRSGGYAVKFLEMDYEEIVRMRRNLILNTFVDFDPDLVLVDKKPLGISDELAPMLELASRRAHRTKVALVLRDILDAPESTRQVWARNRYHEAIRDHYDQVLVLGSPCVFDFAREYDFPEETRAKLTYCGYVGRERGSGFRERVRAELGLQPDEKLVLATVGGGDDGDRILSCYVDGWRQAQSLRDRKVKTLLVCGPEMSATNRRMIINGGEENGLIVREFSDDMMTCMDAADVVVCMGGYNTVCELLTLRKPAVVVPRARPVQEQWIRAERMAAMGLMHAIHPDQLQPSVLMDAVTAELDRIDAGVDAPVPAIDLKGLTRLYEATSSLLEEGESTSGSYLRPAQVLR